MYLPLRCVGKWTCGLLNFAYAQAGGQKNWQPCQSGSVGRNLRALNIATWFGIEPSGVNTHGWAHGDAMRWVIVQ